MSDAPHSKESHDAALAALLTRLAAPAGVHLYEFEMTPDDEYRCTVFVADAIASMLGPVPEGADVEEAWEACVHDDDREVYEGTVTDLRAGLATEIEYRLVGFDGVTRWVWERCVPREHRADGIMVVDGIVADITERHRIEEELAAAHDRLAHMAYHDPLTELPNRRLFTEHLEVAIERAHRDGSAVAVLFIDLDGFKDVNDDLGHGAGDAVLMGVATRLRDITRTGDVVARLGGDEFLMLVTLETPTRPTDEVAAALAGRVRLALKPPLRLPAGLPDVHQAASVGVALFPQHASSAEALVRHADAAMYADKSSSRRAA